MFEKFYVSDWQQPILLWICILLVGVFILGKYRTATPAQTQSPKNSPFFLWITALFFMESALDAGLTSNMVKLSGVAAKIIPLFFVIAGDFRVFALVLMDSQRTRKALLYALGLCLLTPFLSQFTQAFWIGFFHLEDKPDLFMRVLFLNYEIIFLGIFASFSLLWRKKLTSLQKLAFVYYGLWAGADFLILWNYPKPFDAAFLLRLIPNILYYAGLPLFWSPKDNRTGLQT